MYNCNDTILGEKPVWDATFEKKKKNKGVFVVTRFTTREGNEHRQVKTSEALWARTGNVGGIAFFSPKE